VRKVTDPVPRLVAEGHRQGGIITREQSIKLGTSDRVLSRLVASGTLERLYPGVYLLAGVNPTHDVNLKGALAALGPAAVASHYSAAWLQGFDAAPRVPHVTMPANTRSKLHGDRLIVHRSNRAVQVRHFQGIPCTDPARTIVDLAATLSDMKLATAIDVALSHRLIRIGDLERECQLSLRLPGAATLRRCLEELGYIGAPNPSVLESRMARLFKRYDLPRPKAEVHTGPDGCYRIDYTYLDCRVAMEVYGYVWHHSPEQMKYDLARQRRLVLEGWVVLIYTWRDVTFEAPRVAAEIESARTGLLLPHPHAAPALGPANPPRASRSH
jgi:8-oxo-dGTP pyrophosphatase MutT (NUDIX family)